MQRPRGLGWMGACTLLITLGLAIGPSRQAAAAEDETPWLGVEMQALGGSLREGLNYSGDGVIVREVVDGSPADRAGVQTGDILVSVNGRSVRAPDDVTRIVRAMRVGQSVSLAIVRDGNRRSLTARLAARSDRDEIEDNDSDQDHGDADRDEARRDRDEARRDRDQMKHDMDDMKHDLKHEMGDKDDDGMTWNMDPDQPFDMHGFVLRGMGRGRLGVRVESLNSDLGGYFNTPGGKGALVVEVLKDTPAERAGLKAGDVITRVGDRSVADADDLVRALRSSDDRASITYSRRGSSRTTDVRLDAAPRAWRFDGDRMGLNGGDRVRIFRSGPDGGSDRELRDEMKQLREELENLRQRLDKIEHD